jgi:hypothetical protein
MTRGRLPKRPGTDRSVHQSNPTDWAPVHRAAAVTVAAHPPLGAEMWTRTFLYGLCTRGQVCSIRDQALTVRMGASANAWRQ